MKRHMSESALLLMVCLVPNWGSAYEVDTHAVIADRALDRSVLGGPDVAPRLGWSRYRVGQEFEVPASLPEYPGLDRYLDIVPTAWTQSGAIFPNDGRRLLAWERNNFPGLFRGNGTVALGLEAQIRAWLMRGAVREDDLTLADYQPDDPPPDADPFGEIKRVYEHFYDPIVDRGLDPPFVGCGSLPDSPGYCDRSPDWALGESGSVTNVPTTNTSRRNHFSWADAREAMWCGLTYRKSGVSPQSDAAIRRLCWATSVKSIGHVLHLLHDVSQPQHVRNDRHNPPGNPVWDPTGTSMARRTYEIYTNWRATRGQDIASPDFEREQFENMFGGTADLIDISTRAYPIPRFARASDYFTTRRDGLSVLSRRGLADFTNRNLFSEGTIFDSTYAYPPSDRNDALFTRDLSPTKSLPDGRVYREERYLYAGTDSFEVLAADPALAATNGKVPVALVSMWASMGSPAEVSDRRIPLEFYNAHADMLIPRAIAYSAGLIDFFFRGTLEVSAPTDIPIALLDHGTSHTVSNGYPMSGGQVFGFRKARLRVRNTTPTISVSGGGTVPQGAASGQLVAVARYHRNPCYLPSMDGEWTYNFATAAFSVPSGACAKDQLRTAYEELSASAPIVINISGQLDGGSPTLFEFDFSADPIPVNATDLRFQLVYRGQLGEERDGIAVGNIDTREPGYYVIQNGTDYYATQGAWQMAPGSGPNAPANLVSMSADFYLGTNSCGGAGVRLFTATNLAPSRILRVAIVEANRASELKGAAAIGGGSPNSICSVSNIQPVRQAATEEIAAGVWNPHPLARVRGYSYDKAHYWHKVENGDVPASEFGQSLPNLSNVSPVPGVVVFAAGIPARGSEPNPTSIDGVAGQTGVIAVQQEGAD